MMDERPIGKVTATEKKPTSCTTVSFWVHKDVIIRPFDIVRIDHLAPPPSREVSHTYAIVQDLHFITDSQGHLASYVSSDFGDLTAEPQNQRIGTTVADAEVLFNDLGIEMPLRDGALVHWADKEGIRKALGIDARKNPIPAGFIQMSNGEEIPVELESSYLLGPEGAHLNMAGISGLATKTSYSMFLLSAIQQKMGDRVSLVVFNVKGQDLLRIDEPNDALPEEDRRYWEQCQLAPEPFRDVTYLYPFARRPKDCYTCSHASRDVVLRQQRERRAFNYFYDVETGKKRLDLLFADIDDPNSTIESIIHGLPDIDANDWDAFREDIRKRAEKGGDKEKHISIQSWRRFARLLRTRTEYDIFTQRARTEVEAKRPKLICEAVRELRAGRVLVIDIAPLQDYLQCLVFGDTLRTIYEIMLGSDEEVSPSDLGRVVVFADELNKYAPKGGESGRSLTQALLDITERGRSLGVVLFGAEQFRSGVHDRVLGNCSTNVFGRTSPVEIEKCPDYRFFPPSHKSAIVRLTKGQLLLQHAVFKTHLVKIKFPRPSYFQPKVD